MKSFVMSGVMYFMENFDVYGVLSYILLVGDLLLGKIEIAKECFSDCFLED